MHWLGQGFVYSGEETQFKCDGKYMCYPKAGYVAYHLPRRQRKQRQESLARQQKRVWRLLFISQTGRIQVVQYHAEWTSNWFVNDLMMARKASCRPLPSLGR